MQVVGVPPAARDSNLECVHGCGWGAGAQDFPRTSRRPPPAARPPLGAEHLASVQVQERLVAVAKAQKIVVKAAIDGVQV